MKVGFAGSVTAIVLYPIFVWIFGVEGLIIGIIISSLTRNLFGLYVLRRKYGVSPDLKHTGKTVLCSVVSAGSAYGAVQILSSSPLLSLLLGSATFISTYLLLAPVTGAIEGRDIENLDSMLRELSVIYPFARLLLNIEEKILGLMQRQSRNS